MNNFMKVAIYEAIKGFKKKDGGPFGAVVVKNNKIISQAHNMVLKTNDPTNHAEMIAIRKACKKLKRFDLSDCELYSSGESCPMCFSAIHWAKIKKVYYGCTRLDAEKIGFNDKFIYDVIKGKAKKEQVKIKWINRKECLIPFEMWRNKKDNIFY